MVNAIIAIARIFFMIFLSGKTAEQCGKRDGLCQLNRHPDRLVPQVHLSLIFRSYFARNSKLAGLIAACSNQVLRH
jgi:hypothetical protein